MTSDARVWAVDYDCMGVFRNHKPSMRVFDLHSGKRLKEISGRGSGVRYVVSASRKGDRIAAYTCRMRIQVDWLDGTSWGAPVDHTFSVWNSDNFEGVVTSQEVGLPNYDWQGLTLPLSFRISAGGKYVIVGATIYEVPLLPTGEGRGSARFSTSF